MKQTTTPSPSAVERRDAEVEKLENLMDAKLGLNDPAIIEQSQKIDVIMDGLFSTKEA